MGRWLRSQAPLTLAMEAVTGAGMAHKRGATWGEAKVGARALRAAVHADAHPVGRGPQQVPRDGRELRRGVPGPNQLFAAEAGQRPELREAVDALRALRAGPATQTRAGQRA
jgi:2-dehydropantoate 2-reductase